MPPYRFAHTYNEIIVDGKRLSVIDVHWDEMKPLKKIVGGVIKVGRKLFRKLLMGSSKV